MSNCKESIKEIPVICVVKDKKGNIFTSPMTFQNEECAIRWFESLVQKGDTTVCDYDLYLLGHYSEAHGQIFPLNENSLYLLKSGDEYRSKLDIIESLKQDLNYFKEQNTFKSSLIDKLVAKIKEREPDFSFEKFVN